MRGRRLSALLAITAPLFLGACANHVTLGYTPTSETQHRDGVSAIWLGSLEDQRENKGSNQIGSIRGGFGNPIYVLTVDEPLPDIVRKAMASALTARGLLSDRPDAPLTLSGQIKRLECNQFITVEAHATLVLTLTDTASGKVIWTNSFLRDADTGFTLASGIFGSVDDLRALTNKVLQQAIDGGLDSPDFLQTVLLKISK